MDIHGRVKAGGEASAELGAQRHRQPCSRNGLLAVSAAGNPAAETANSARRLRCSACQPAVGVKEPLKRAAEARPTHGPQSRAVHDPGLWLNGRPPKCGTSARPQFGLQARAASNTNRRQARETQPTGPGSNAATDAPAHTVTGPPRVPADPADSHTRRQRPAATGRQASRPQILPPPRRRRAIGMDTESPRAGRGPRRRRAGPGARN